MKYILFPLLMASNAQALSYKFHADDKVVIKNCKESEHFYRICGLIGRVGSFGETNQCQSGIYYRVHFGNYNEIHEDVCEENLQTTK